MTVLIKYPHQTKENNKDFFKRKNQEFTNLDWAKWGGWFDTDGNIYPPHSQCRLQLTDRQPVELFSKIFECSLGYYEYNTMTPERHSANATVKSKNCTGKIFFSSLSGEKAKWFTKNVCPYLLNEEKKDYAAKLLGYPPQSKDIEKWTRDEITNYLASAIGGDGSVVLNKRRKNFLRFPRVEISLISSNSQYLSCVKYIVENKFKIYLPLTERFSYKTKEGEKTSYALRFYGSRGNSENLHVFKNLIKDNVMTLDRKKQKIQEFVNYIS